MSSADIKVNRRMLYCWVTTYGRTYRKERCMRFGMSWKGLKWYSSSVCMFWHVHFHLQCCSVNGFRVPNHSPFNVVLFLTVHLLMLPSFPTQDASLLALEVWGVMNTHWMRWSRFLGWTALAKCAALRSKWMRRLRRSPACLELGVPRTGPHSIKSYGLWPF